MKVYEELHPLEFLGDKSKVRQRRTLRKHFQRKPKKHKKLQNKKIIKVVTPRMNPSGLPLPAKEPTKVPYVEAYSERRSFEKKELVLKDDDAKLARKRKTSEEKKRKAYQTLQL